MKKLKASLANLFICNYLYAQEVDTVNLAYHHIVDSIAQSFHCQHGSVKLENRLAALHVPQISGC